MKNLKRILSLALASVMVMGMMVVGASAAFNDQADINPVNVDAVNTMVALGVISGKGNNTFDPKGSVTRAEMATMVAVALHGGDANFRGTTTTGFTDVDSDAGMKWAAKYIKYCVDQGILSGVGGNKFNPNANVTAQEAAAMILLAMGYRKEMLASKSGDWASVINQKAEINKLYDDTAVTDYTQAIDRQNAAQMVYNGITTAIPVLKDTYNTLSGEHSYTVDKEGPAQSGGKTLLETVFDAKISYGMLTGATYDKETGVYTYDVDADGADRGNAFSDTELKTTMDVTDLFMQNVKIITCGTANDVIGITAAENGVVAEGNLGAGFVVVDNGKTHTINGRKVTGTDTTAAASVEIYNFNDSTSSKTVADYDSSDSSKASDIGAICHYSYKLIDNTADGAVDCVVFYPVTVAKVTDLTEDTITLTTYNNATIGDSTTATDKAYDLEEEVLSMPENLKKGNWVIVREDEIVEDNVALELAETVEGAVGARRVAAKQVRVNGNWYNPAGTVDAVPAISTTEKTVVMVNGYYAHLDPISEEEPEADLDMIVITELADDKTFADFEGYLAANVFYLKDGSTGTVKLEASYLKSAKNGSNAAEYEGVALFGIYTYADADKDGKLELTPIYDAEDNNTPADDVTEVYDNLEVSKLTLATASAKATMGSSNIADNAVVYAIYTNASGKLTIDTKTGKQVKAWTVSGATEWGTASSVGFAKTVNGLDYIQLMVLFGDTDENTLPDAVGTKGNYGYVLTNPYQEKAGGTTYLIYDIWTGDETITVKDTFVTDRAAGENVTALKVAAKNDVITYEDKGNGVITLEGKIDTKSAVLGYSKEDGIIKLADKGAGANSAAEKNITDGTTVIFVSKKSGTVEGVRSGSGAIKLAAKDTENDGEFLCNVIVELDDDNVKLLVVEVNNALGGSTKAE